MSMIYKVVFLSLIHSLFFGELLLIGDYEDGKQGMFASANKILGQLFLYEKQVFPEWTGLVVDFDVFGFYYDPAHGKNWWEYYFEPISVGVTEGGVVKKLSKIEGLEACALRRKMNKRDIHYLVRKYFHPLPWVQRKVDQFVLEHF